MILVWSVTPPPGAPEWDGMVKGYEVEISKTILPKKRKSREGEREREREREREVD